MLIPKFQFSNTLVLDFSIVSFHWNVIMNSRFIVLVLFLALFSGSLARPQASKGPKDTELSSYDQERDVERMAFKEPKDPKLNSNDEEDVERRASKEPKDPEMNSNENEEENVERRASKEPKNPELNSNDEEENVERRGMLEICNPWFPSPGCSRPGSASGSGSI